MPIDEPAEPKAGEDDDEEGGMDPAMAAMMGFGGFTTTKVSRFPPNRKAGLELMDEREKGMGNK